MSKEAEYAIELGETQQIGRLYFVVFKPWALNNNYHFQIFVLPKGEKVRPNGHSEPLNDGAVEVYGVIHNHYFGFENYGWKHEGKWQKDFEAILKKKRRKRELQSKIDYENSPECKRNKKEYEKKCQEREILKSY